MTLTNPNSDMVAGPPIEIIQQVVLQGDLNQLTPDQKLGYISGLCEHLGISQAGKPFDLLKFQGKEVAYPNKGCAEMLRKRWNITVDTPSIDWKDDTVYVTVVARMGARSDVEIGAVYCNKPMERGNATKKALTQAKRRVTFSLVGLSLFNEEDVLEAIEVQPPAELPEETQTKSERFPPATGAVGMTKEVFADKCKDLGAKLVNAGGPAGKAAYREVLEKSAGVKQANHVKPEHFEAVIGCLEELVQMSGTDPVVTGDTQNAKQDALIDEIGALEALTAEDDMLTAWDQTVNELDPQPTELTEMTVEQLTKYRDLLKN